VKKLKLPEKLVKYFRKINMLSANVDTGCITSRYDVDDDEPIIKPW